MLKKQLKLCTTTSCILIFELFLLPQQYFLPEELQTASSPPRCSQCPPVGWPSAPARTAGSDAQHRTARQRQNIKREILCQMHKDTHVLYLYKQTYTYTHLGFYIIEGKEFEAKPNLVIFLDALLHKTTGWVQPPEREREFTFKICVRLLYIHTHTHRYIAPTFSPLPLTSSYCIINVPTWLNESLRRDKTEIISYIFINKHACNIE